MRISLLARVSNIFGSGKYDERSIEVDRNVLVIGRFEARSKLEEPIRFTPKFLLSENKEALLKHLDSSIVKTTKRCNRVVAAGLGVLMCHFAYTRWNRQAEQQPHQL